MSQLRETNPKILVYIASHLLDAGFNAKNPYDDFDDNENHLSSIMKYFGMEINDIKDVEFMAAFITENLTQISEYKKDESLLNVIIPTLEMPELKKYKIGYEIWGPATLTESYSTKWESYSKDWAKNSLRHYYQEGDFNYYEGDYESYETNNFEADNFEINWVHEINENKKPVLDKLIIENTKDLLNHLDRETLLKLREIINRKLSS